MIPRPILPKNRSAVDKVSAIYHTIVTLYRRNVKDGSELENDRAKKGRYGVATKL